MYEPIAKNQVWESKKSGKQFKIIGKGKNNHWKAIELSERTDYYTSTHSFLPFILWQKFKRIK